MADTPLTLSLARHKLRRFLRSYRVPRGALCLDVGSGEAPWPRADVLLEARPLAAGERLVIDRPFVVGSLEALPFRTRAFGYVHASHVLEHVADPRRAVAELTRVAERGLVEVPARLHELLLPRPDHLWSVRVGASGRLVFERPPASDPELTAWIASCLETDRRFSAFYWARLGRELVHTIEWRDALGIELAAEPSRQAQLPLDAARLESCLEAARARGRRLRPRLKRALLGPWRARPFDLDALLACPACQGRLERRGESCLCAACGRRYERISGAYVLLP